MTNWESEIKFYQLQQSQKEQDARSEESRKLQEDRIRQEKERGEMMTSMRIDYDSRIVPEFELLDKFFIRENLLEIKNQIWKIGEVSKNPLDFNDYFQKKGKPKIFHKDYCANYTLAVITIGYCPKSSIWAPYEGTTYYPEKIDISSESLSVSTDLTNIYINGKPGEITIPLTQDIEETKEIIHQTLIKDLTVFSTDARGISYEVSVPVKVFVIIGRPP